ncbi:unnamed protein product [Prorocentrum cordatum]|uniref:Exocyst complex component Sec10 n=1 Tax=Prorocentrum cordatum TaxID=2364126 RepID=A0ABN9R881_9DINO|nr:unnamed protein product [Polarella glacialis]
MYAAGWKLEDGVTEGARQGGGRLGHARRGSGGGRNWHGHKYTSTSSKIWEIWQMEETTIIEQRFGNMGNPGISVYLPVSPWASFEALAPARPPERPRPRVPQSSLAQAPGLEEQVADGLELLLGEARAGLAEARRRGAAEREGALRRAREGCARAELEFRRQRALVEGGIGPADGPGDGPAAVEELAAQLRVEAEAAARGAGSLVEAAAPGPPLFEQVAELVQRCSLQPGATDSATQRRGLAAVVGLADLLLEYERDCLAMRMALSGDEAQEVGDWIERVARQITSQEGGVQEALRPESLAHQLRSENELLREALRQ